LTPEADTPLRVRFELLALGSVQLGRSVGSINMFERRRDHIASDCDDRFLLIVNRGVIEAHGQVARFAPLKIPTGAGFLTSYTEPGMHGCSRDYEFLILMLPRRLFTGRQAKADELIGATVPAANEALRLLRTYADMLLDGEGLSNPAVLAHAGQTLTDLAVLAFGTDRDNTEAARASGLRAARLAAVLRQIRLDYADPEISPERIAGRVGISTRYLHELLQETGISCAERIQELRLEAAFAILCRQTGKNRKVSDTAYAVGFNDVSYFNRCFRRKFGITPTGARGPRIWLPDL
jgi:AraC-like DNA-binding protein